VRERRCEVPALLLLFFMSLLFVLENRGKGKGRERKEKRGTRIPAAPLTARSPSLLGGKRGRGGKKQGDIP